MEKAKGTRCAWGSNRKTHRLMPRARSVAFLPLVFSGVKPIKCQKRAGQGPGGAQVLEYAACVTLGLDVLFDYRPVGSFSASAELETATPWSGIFPRNQSCNLPCGGRHSSNASFVKGTPQTDARRVA